VSLADLLRRADLSYLESWRELTRWTADGTILETRDLLCFAPPTRSRGFNGAMRCGAGVAPDAERTVALARDFFAARQRGFTLHTREHLDGDLVAVAEAAGFERLRPDAPIMVLARPVRDPVLDPPLRLVDVDDDAGAADFAAVACAAYAATGISFDVLARVFAGGARVRAPHVAITVAYDRDVPIAGGFVLLGHGIAGVYWIGTTPAGRRRGAADAVTRHLGNLAFARGAALVVLQASEQGRPIYQRIGYREVSSYRRYLVRNAPASP